MLNRGPLFASLDRAIAATLADGGLLGLLVVRTQRLREVNLLFGYAAGERFVDAVSSVIASALRPRDEIVRIGECDFAVILPALLNREHVALAAAKLVRVLHEPVDAGGQQVLPSVAIGGALCPDHSTDGDLLCRLADSACDQAATIPDRFALYTTPEFSAAFAHGDLRDAIAANQLQLFLQPIRNLADGRTDRCEALARWTHPELGAVPPDLFVRVAEQTGLIGELTRWSLNVVLRHAAEARRAGDDIAMAVNLSVSVLQQPSFVAQVRDMLRFWEVPPETMVLEITESALMTDLVHCQRLLGTLRDMGFGIAIDDFGTGYSSMAYLKSLPVTELKIDKSFVLDMQGDARAQKLVASMIDLSHHMGLSVVAEGVENEATLALLRGMGCDHAQGYHIRRPGPAVDVIAELARRPVVAGAASPGPSVR